MTQQSKLIPVLREGVDVLKMIFYKELKPCLEKKYPDMDASDIQRLSGAIINDLFGTPHDGHQFKAFFKTHKALIEKELNSISKDFPYLRIPLTDALRTQFLCDSLEGINNEAALIRAKGRGILVVDRDVPLPKNFISLVKTLGVSYHLLSPHAPELH